MDTLIALVNRIQRACTVLGDHGADAALPTLWEALPSVAVVGGQVRSSHFFHSFPFNPFRCLRYWFLVFSRNAEFWKVFGSGEHCRPRFSSAGIRFFIFVALTVRSLIINFFVFIRIYAVWLGEGNSWIFWKRILSVVFSWTLLV